MRLIWRGAIVVDAPIHRTREVHFAGGHEKCALQFRWGFYISLWGEAQLWRWVCDRPADHSIALIMIAVAVMRRIGCSPNRQSVGGDRERCQLGLATMGIALRTR